MAGKASVLIIVDTYAFSAQWIVLTAAHCIAHNLTTVVYVGVVDQSNFTKQDQVIKVKDYRVGRWYTYGTTEDDIAVLLLSSPLKFNSK